MNQYRLDLSYKGTLFQGWQTQPERNSVQDHLNHAISIICREAITVIGSSRTDSGVHAEHQVASFRAKFVSDERKFLRSLNALLPRDIKVQKITAVTEDFHPIRSSQAKLYRYGICLDDGVSPLIQDLVWKTYDLDRDLLKTLLPKFIGSHNYRSFCAKDSSAKTFERTILDFQLQEVGPYLFFYILGEGFLKQMVRNIIGTIVDICQGKIPFSELDGIFKARDRTKAGQTAPACGLSLLRIFYELPPHNLPEFINKQSSFRVFL